MTKGDALGTRIKRYEAASRHFLPPKQPVVIRIDGRAFHTYTRGMDKPFDMWLMEAMAYATERTAKELSGFKLGYTQSDEASFLITDFDELTTQGWFDYNLSKLISISASTFGMHFNQRMYEHTKDIHDCTAVFDSRAFVVPMADVANVFLWRQKDWYRNSVQMLGQAHFSHRQLNGKKLSDIHDMLHAVGINWAKLEDNKKNGTFIMRVTEESLPDEPGEDRYVRTTLRRCSVKADYTMINDWITGTMSVGTQ